MPTPNYEMMDNIAAEAAYSLGNKYNLNKFEVVDHYLDFMAPLENEEAGQPLANRGHDFAVAFERLFEPFYLEDVESSNIARIGYCNSQRELYVVFKHRNEVYTFEGVEPDVFVEMAEANSVGRFFAHRIKDVYTFRRG